MPKAYRRACLEVLAYALYGLLGFIAVCLLQGAAGSTAPTHELLAELSLPANAGRSFGALTGDRNPIHMHALTSQLFGFKKPIAHAMYIVARLEAELVKKGRSLTACILPSDRNCIL